VRAIAAALMSARRRRNANPILALAPDAWWDASDAATITDAGAGKVSSLLDKSGNSHHMLQTVAGNRPTTGTRTQNGLNVIDFVRASAQFLDAGDVMDLGANGFSIFGVVKFDDTSGSSPWGKNVAGTTDGRYGLIRTGGNLLGIYDEGATVAGTVSRSDSSTACRQISQILTRDGASSTHDLIRDGGIGTQSFTDVATAWDTTAPWRLGRYGISTAFDFDGFIAEVIVFLRTVTSDERDAVQAYLKAKWGTA
jgi:hypothetical protein